MPVLTIFARAVRRAAASFRLVAMVYLMNLILAGVIALGFRSALVSMGNIAALAPLMNGFDFTIVSDFTHTRGDALSVVMRTTFLMMVVSWMGNAVMAGGVLTLLRDGEAFSLRAFFAGCGTYALRFISLSIAMGIIVIVAVILLSGLSGSVAGAMSRDATSENVVIAWWAGTALGALSITLIILMMGDYARVIMVQRDPRSMLRTLLGSMRFVIRNLPGALGLQLMMACVAVSCVVIYLWIEPNLPATSEVMILVLFLLQQACIVARTCARVVFYAGELGFYNARRPLEPTAAAESMSTLAGA